MRLASLPLLALTLLAACTPKVPNAARSPSLDNTAVGKNRCASQGSTRPFVVEWDATDLSTFEAKASRDIVLVRFEGCDLTPLYDCSDAGMPGRFGRYKPPEWTTGSVEAIQIEDEIELFTKLPLGAASLSGRVQKGQKLRLEYFVSGMINATRGSVSKKELSAIEGCKSATHFVSGYNLGAFELFGSETTGAGASVSVPVAEVGGQRKSSASALRKGGALADCSSQNQLKCRVPIRLELRPVQDLAPQGEPVPDAPAEPVADRSARNRDRELTPAQQARALRDSAKSKRRLKDGPGCLEDLDRADRIDAQGRKELLETRAVCLMMAGKCAEGRTLLTEVVKGDDKDHTKSDAAVTEEVNRYADSLCPVRDRSPQARLQGAISAIHAQKNSTHPDAEVCINSAKEIEAVLPNFPKPHERFGPGRADGVSAWYTAAQCLGKAGRCADALVWFLKSRQMDPNTTLPWTQERKAEQEKSFPQYVPECTRK